MPIYIATSACGSKGGSVMLLYFSPLFIPILFFLSCHRHLRDHHMSFMPHTLKYRQNPNNEDVTTRELLFYDRTLHGIQMIRLSFVFSLQCRADSCRLGASHQEPVHDELMRIATHLPLDVIKLLFCSILLTGLFLPTIRILAAGS